MRTGVDCKGREWEERELSPKMSDLRFQRFGNLTPLFPITKTNKNYGVFWLCKCDCGNFIIRSKSSLINHTSDSCGCSTQERKKIFYNNQRNNMIGKKFNKLTIVDIGEIRTDSCGNRRTYYKCMCDCGNSDPVIVRGTDLIIGKSCSCGCAKKDSEARKREDLTGKRFGKLTVTGFAYTKDQSGYWNCVCDCQNKTIVKGSYLNANQVLSCGCLKSAGEFNIMQLLNSENIEYLHDKIYFKDLLSDGGVPLRFDFILFDDIGNPFRLIEFDGPQHKRPNRKFTEEDVKLIQKHDKYKNQYALSHNIPLVRIPYSKRDSMCIDDLLGDKYLIKEND